MSLSIFSFSILIEIVCIKETVLFLIALNIMVKFMFFHAPNKKNTQIILYVLENNGLMLSSERFKSKYILSALYLMNILSISIFIFYPVLLHFCLVL